MKILMFSHTGLVTGGAEQCLLEYVDVLVRNGHECKVIIPHDGDMRKVLTQRNISSALIGYGWAIRPHKKVNPHKILTSNGHSLVRIFQEVERYKPDLIMVNTAVIPWGLYAGRAFHIPTVLLVHEILNDKDPSLDVVPSYKEYADTLNRNTDFVVYNSKFVKSEYANELTLPSTPDGILYPLPPLDEQVIAKYYKKNVFNDIVKIAIVGALAPRKNQMEALHAAKALKDKGINNFRIDLYGDAAANLPYVRKLKSFISKNNLTEHIKIKGFAPNIYERMNDYNIILSTSTYEPFGRTIIEAQLFGRVAIANNTGGGPELVTDGKTGLIYECGDAKGLAEKIQWVMQNQKQATKLGLNAKSIQLKKYIVDSRYDALLDSVNHFANNHKQPDDADMFNPIRSLFEYNHQLNERYKHIERVINNRATRAAKHSVVRLKSKTKRVIKDILAK